MKKEPSRPGSRGGGLDISPSVANFTLANRNDDMDDYEEMKSGHEEEVEQQEDEDAPQTFKANFVRRNTVLRK